MPQTTRILLGSLSVIALLAAAYLFWDTSAVNESYLEGEEYAAFEREVRRQDSLAGRALPVFEEIAAEIAGKVERELSLPFRLDTASLGRYLSAEYRVTVEQEGFEESAFGNDRYFGIGRWQLVTEGAESEGEVRSRGVQAENVPGAKGAESISAILFVVETTSVYEDRRLVVAVQRGDSLTDVQKIADFRSNVEERVAAAVTIEEGDGEEGRPLIRLEWLRRRKYPVRQEFRGERHYTVTPEGRIARIGEDADRTENE